LGTLNIRPHTESGWKRKYNLTEYNITDPRTADYWIENSVQDLYFLCRCVLMTIKDPTPGFKDLWKPTHKRVTDFLTEFAVAGQHCILLFPRHWLKSYLIGCGWTMQRLLKNALSGGREGFLFSHAVEPMAIRLKGRIKHNLLYNDLLRGFLSLTSPEVARQLDAPESTAELWTKEEDKVWGNVLTTGAVEKTLASMHFDIHIGDDLVVEENSKNPTQLRKVITWHKLAQSLLSPEGIEILLGTRYAFDDLYGYLIKKFLKPKKDYHLEAPIVEVHRGNWHLLQADCWEDQKNETGSTFPNKFPEEELKRLQEIQGDEFYYQYRNTPIAKGGKKYQTEWFNPPYVDADIPSIVNTVMLLDVTDKEKETSDYTGMVIVDLAVNKIGYIRLGERRRLTDANLIDWVCEEAPKYNVASIEIESTKFDTIVDLMTFIIPRKLKNKEIPEGYREFVATIPHICRERTSRGRPKKVRIENMCGYVERRKILFPATGAEDLVEELLRLGSSTQDDVADAFGYLQDVLVFPEQDDPERVYLFPEGARMTPEEREEKIWADYKEECDLGENSSEGEDYF